MSHFNAYATQMTDAEILKASLQDLGLRVKTDAIVRGHHGQSLRAEIVAVLDGEYDLGWSRNSQGYFDLIADDLIADFWGVTVDELASIDGAAKKYLQAVLIELIEEVYAVNKVLTDSKSPGLKIANIKLLSHQLELTPPNK
jgi:hypothetical protein